MEKNIYMVSTRDSYKYKLLRDIFKKNLNGALFASRHKRKQREVDGEMIFEDYYTLAAKVDKKTEDILRNEIRLSSFPIYGKTHLA